jgi:hypothetical protein
MAQGAYRVEHDQSKNLLTYHDLLQRFFDLQTFLTHAKVERLAMSMPRTLQGRPSPTSEPQQNPQPTLSPSPDRRRLVGSNRGQDLNL